MHRSVLVRETLEYLAVRPGGVYADLTFGEGGHTGELLKAGAARVVGVDRDPEALEIYRKGGEFRDDPRLTLVHARFSEFPDIASEMRFDGILADLGVSTRQLLIAERGFSFSGAGPLDMRMNGSEELPLSERLDGMTVEELAQELQRNADLKGAYSMARRILQAHAEGRLKDTLDLARLAGRPSPRGGSHPATPLFLALRMMVNDELGEVEKAVPRLLPLLADKGRLAIITFHSTEDRVVKRLFLRLAGRCICEKDPCLCPREPHIEILTRKPVCASEDELRDNPRARSAKLRCVEKL